MGTLSFTVNGQAYGAHGAGARIALDFVGGAAEQELIRHHVPGVDGTYKTRCGRLGRTLVATVRYYASLANVLAYAAADRDAMAGVAVTVIEPDGTTRTNCELSVWRWVRTPVAVSANNCIGDVEMTLRCDA